MATQLARRLIINQYKTLFSNNQRVLLKHTLNTIKKQPQQQLFSTSSRRNAIPPLLWIIFKPVTKLGAILVGRGFRKWWTSLPQVKRTIFMDHLKRNKFRYGIIVSSSSVASVIYYNAHIQETPITHRKRFIIFSSSHLGEIENLEKDQVIWLLL